jgi:hypothetical protein
MRANRKSKRDRDSLRRKELLSLAGSLSAGRRENFARRCQSSAEEVALTL